MTTNDNIKPLVDRILMNPLQFTQVSNDSNENKGSGISSDTIKNTSYIVIGRKKSNRSEDSNMDQKIDDVNYTAEKKIEKKPENVVKPKSMAEALAMYTNSGTKSKNENNAKVLSSNQNNGDDNNNESDGDTGADNPNSDKFSEINNKNNANGNEENEKEEAEESDEDDMEYQDNDDETDTNESTDSDSSSSDNLIGNTITYNNGNNYMDEDVGEDVGEALDMIRKETMVEKDRNSDTSDYNETVNDDNRDGNFDGRVGDSDDNSDKLDEILDSERIGLLEESIAYEIEKEKRKECRVFDMTRKQNENYTIGNKDQDEEELKHKLPLGKREDVGASNPEMKDVYQFNENVADEGSTLPSKIIKNWGSEMSVLKPRGLLNHGVTCYTNAAVQALLHIPAVQHYLWDVLRGKYRDTIKPTSVTMTLAETSKKMWFPNDKLKKKLSSYINPNKLINRLEDINCMMSEWQQEDSHEYFMSLMSRLQEDSVPKGHKMTESIIYDIFGGLLKQLVTCKSCGGISETEQPFYDLSLHLRGKKSSSNESLSSNTSLNDDSMVTAENREMNSSNGKSNDIKDENVTTPILPNDKNNANINNINNTNQFQSIVNRKFTIEKSIKDFFSPELIKVDNEQKGYVCEKCHKTTNAVKRNYIMRAPETLLVHLKKFRFNGTSSSKMKQAVSYPMFLDLTEYCDKETIQSREIQLPLKYQLISVVVHEGRSLSSGHYITHCKQPDGSWATYDDEYINKITERDVLREPNAYYLIYTRLTPKCIKLNDTLPKGKITGLPNIKKKKNKSGNSDKHKGLDHNRNATNEKSKILSLASNTKNRKKQRKNKKRKLNK